MTILKFPSKMRNFDKDTKPTPETFHLYYPDFLWKKYHEVNNFLFAHGEIEGNAPWIDFINDHLYNAHKESVCSLEIYNLHQWSANLHSYLLENHAEGEV